MNTATILTYPDPRLAQECARVPVINEETAKIVELLKATLFASGGAGLAAPQIGILQRICVVACPSYLAGGPEKADVYINPIIVESEGETISREGCLSIPNFFWDVKRFEKVKVQAYDLTGQGFLYESSGRYAICLQHEIDHLDGKLFIDRLSRMRRGLAMKKISKLPKK